VTGVRYVQIDEILAIALAVNGTDRSMRDLGLLVSAIERPRSGTVPPPVSVAGPFVEDVAQDAVDVPVIAKRLST
jgi:death-on-curing protein